jgi:tight adherence protein C
MLIISALIFMAVSLGLASAYMFLAPNRTHQRLKLMAAPAAAAEWTETVVKVVGPLARLSSPQGDWESSPLRIKFLNAGIRGDSARLVYYGVKSLLPMLLALLAFVTLRAMNNTEGLTSLMYVLIAALIGCYLPNFVVHWMRKTRQREIFETFPDATDLILVCVEAGLGLDASLTKVAEEISRKSVALAEELHLTNLELRAGSTREKSLRNLALRTGVDEVGTFATMITQAEKFGTSIGDSLRVFSDDLRHKRQAMAEERAAKIPTKMLIPLVLCIFPSIIMVILGPAMISIIRTMLPMLQVGT